MPSKRGFAAMDRSKQREIASKGGRAAHQDGKFRRNSSLKADYKLGAHTVLNAGFTYNAFLSQNRSHMAEIGRKGGEARGAARRAQAQIRGHQDVAPPEGGHTAVMDEEVEVALAHKSGDRVEGAAEDLDRG